MSETSQQFETTWASDDADLLRVAVAAVVQAGAAASPVVRVEWGGRVSFAVRLSNTKAPFGPPPVGVREEITPVAGVFLRGASKPTPLQWMDRLEPDRQVALLEALDTSPQGRLLSRRLLAASEIDPNHPQIAAGIALLERAGAITAEEAERLRAP
jgi:hypothetical protein